MKTITVSEAISQGYTHFRMGAINDNAESFPIIPLTEENISRCLARSADEELDYNCSKDESDEWGELYFGKYPILCDKPKHPSVTSEDLVNMLVERNELNDELVPASLETMSRILGEEEDFKKGLELINKAMAEFRSYVGTDIKVVL